MENQNPEPKINFRLIWWLMNVTSLVAGLFSDITNFIALSDNKPTSKFFERLQRNLERTAYKKLNPKE